MLEKIRQSLETKQGKAIAIGISAVLLLIAVKIVITSLGSETPDSAMSQMFICTETGKTFRHKNKLGETQPIYSSYSGKNTGVPAEACFWNADGTPKSSPTWVLLNELADKPGPTFCPDCGRLVVGHNPAAGPDAKVPPTKDEYEARKASRKPKGDPRDEER